MEQQFQRQTKLLQKEFRQATVPKPPHSPVNDLKAPRPSKLETVNSFDSEGSGASRGASSTGRPRGSLLSARTPSLRSSNRTSKGSAVRLSMDSGAMALGKR